MESIPKNNKKDRISELKTVLKKERSEIAEQMMKARKSERLDSGTRYTVHRTGKECLCMLGGLKFLFDYLRTLPSNKILDVGVGTGNASSVISQMLISSDLNFEATALRIIPELQKNFPKEKIHITGVETLRGIQDNSLAGIIGVNSIAYSDHPDLAIKRIDQVLVPGGVIKATFAISGYSENYNGTIFKSSEEFIKALHALNYDVAPMKINDLFTSIGMPLSNSILIAIKPGNPNAPTAEELLRSDFDGLKSETKEKMEKGYPVFDIDDD